MSKENLRSRARLPEELDLEDLSKYFLLSPSDLAEIQECRGAVNKIGFAIQLCCLRWFGFLIPELQKVPATVVERIMKQLRIVEKVDLLILSTENGAALLAQNGATQHDPSLR
jgi:hypothetical protein